MKLQRLVTDIEADISRKSFGHRAIERGFRVLCIQFCRRLPDHQPCRLQLRRHVRKAELHRLKAANRLAELLAVGGIALCQFQRRPRRADGAGADVEPTAIKAHHRDLEAVALIADEIFHRHPAIVEEDLRRRLGIPAHLAFLRAETDAGRIRRHGDTADPLRAVIAGADHGHIDIRLAATGDEGLAAVQHIMIAVAHRLGAERRRIRARARFRQAIAREMFHRR